MRCDSEEAWPCQTRERRRPTRAVGLVPGIIIMASASQVFRDLTRFFTPTIPVWDDDYDGLEYKWKIFVFRPGSE
jgi:hypothetical protein